MIVYNVTILITEEREEEFVEWMRNDHIAKVLDTGLFTKAKFMKLLHPSPEEKGETYATQYFCKYQRDLNTYYQDFAPQLREEGLAKFGDSMMGFRTELEIIEEFLPKT